MITIVMLSISITSLRSWSISKRGKKKLDRVYDVCYLFICSVSVIVWLGGLYRVILFSWAHI